MIAGIIIMALGMFFVAGLVAACIKLEETNKTPEERMRDDEEQAEWIRRWIDQKSKLP